MSGLVIKVKVIKAILTHDTEIGSKMDPFVVLKMGTIQKRGKTFDQAGDMPEFNEQFDFLYQGNLTMFHLIVYDEDTTIDDLVGEVQIDLKPIISQQLTPRKWYSLKYNGKIPAGKIMLEFECNRNGITQFENQKIIKQLTKPNIHHIGPLQSEISNEIHHLNSRHRHHNVQKVSHLNHQRYGNRVKSPQIVFSFRDYALHQKNYKQSAFYPNYISNSHLTNQTLTSSHTIKDSLISRNLSSQNKFPLNQNNHIYYHYDRNQINGSNNSYVPNSQSHLSHVNNIPKLNSNHQIPYLNPQPFIGNSFNMLH